MGDDDQDGRDRPTVQRLVEEYGLDDGQENLLRAMDALLDVRLGSRDGKRGGGKGGLPWDTTPKGDDVWLEAKAIAANVVARDGPMTFSDLDLAPRLQDPEFTNIWDYKQWDRFLKRCVGQRPPDGRDWVVFRLPGARSTRYLTLEGYLHCHVAHVARRRKDAKRAVEETRRKYGGTDAAACEICRRRRQKVEDSLQTPVSQKTGSGKEASPEPWSERELAVLTAAQSEREGGTD